MTVTPSPNPVSAEPAATTRHITPFGPPEASTRRTWAAPVLVAAVDAVAVTLGCALGGASAAIAGAAAVVFVAIGSIRRYRLTFTLSALDDVPTVAPRLGLAVFAVAVGSGAELLASVRWGLLALVGVTAGRTASYCVVRRARASGRLAARTIVAGNGPVAMELVSTVDHHPEYGVEVVALLEPPQTSSSGLVIDDPDDIGDVLDQYGISRAIVAYGVNRDADMVALLRAAIRHDVEVHVVPRFFELGVGTSRAGTDHIWGIPLHRVRRTAHRQGAWRLKRVFDVVIAGTCALLTLPLLGVLALAVRLSSPGPILFHQRRIGQDGRIIDVPKLRTLRCVEPGPAGHRFDLVDPEGLAVQLQRQDDVERRLTAVGRVLRSTGLDELPQLWSVVRGDMSIVGPRPEEVTFAHRFADTVHGYGDRHRLPVGLTGWAQVHGLRGDTSIAERVRFDNHYIEHWTLWREIAIVVRTVGVIVRRFLHREA